MSMSRKTSPCAGHVPAIEHVVCIPVSPPGSVEPYRKANKACDNPGLTTHLHIQTCSLLHAAVLLSGFPTYAHDIPGYTWYKYVHNCTYKLHSTPPMYFQTGTWGIPIFGPKCQWDTLTLTTIWDSSLLPSGRSATFSRDGLRRSQSRTSPSALEQKMQKKTYCFPRKCE